MTERHNPASSTRTGKRSKLLGLIHCLGTTFIVAAFTASAQGQSSANLAWNPVAGSAVAGYRLYQGGASLTYTNIIAAGNVTNSTVANLANGANYFFAVTAVGTNGLESAYSSEISYTVPLPTNPPPSIALTAPVNGAGYAAPAAIGLAATVTANGHTITKVQFCNGAILLAEDTSAPFSFAWANVSAGSYSLTARVVYDSGSTVASAAANVSG